MDKYKVTIGLEIHAELKTRTKMFCDSKNDPDEERPNINICPVCMGYPGTLPVINKEAVKHVLKMGVAVGGEIADFTEFDRKNYFYPDIPKGYQISQYKFPLIKGGELNGIKLTRIHLEEDTARSTHHGNHSLIDFNRAGVPLMELVTEPVIHSAKDASAFAKELQLLLQYLGAGEANMEKGEMRVEANISINPKSQVPNSKLGTKVEVKNLNSFKAVEKAIEYEVKRHAELLEKGEKVVQETRGWDETKEITFSQRTKEDSHDYRYFPEPDLPKLKLSKIPEFYVEALKSELPELPWNKRIRYIEQVGVKGENAEVFVRDSKWGSYFDAVLQALSRNDGFAQIAANYITSDLAGLVKNDNSVKDSENIDIFSKVAVSDFARLVEMIAGNLVSSRGAKDLLKKLYDGEKDTDKIAKDGNLLQTSDSSALKEVVEKVVVENPSVVSDYKSGKEVALQFLVGQGMKLSKGSANPEVLKELFKEGMKSE